MATTSQVIALTRSQARYAGVSKARPSAVPMWAPELTRLLAMIDDGDTMVVSRLDRLARPTRNLLNVLSRRGATFRSR